MSRATHQELFDQNFVTMDEICGRTGWSRPTITQKVGNVLPKPYAIVAGTFVWARPTVEKIIEALKEQKETEMRLRAAQRALREMAVQQNTGA